MPIKLLATADLHLGKKSSYLPRSTDESSVRFTWRRMVDWAMENRVDAFVMAGDIIDRDNRYFEAIGPILRGFEDLEKAGIPVVMVSGNHDFDVLPEIVRNRKFEHIHLLGEKGTWQVKTLDNRIQFLGWSFPLQHIREDPSLQLESVRNDLDPNLPAVGVLHGDLNAAESMYAPVDLNNINIRWVDVWVLGHIHKPGIHRPDSPLILYPGSPQALSPKETGVHGPYLIQISDNGQVNAGQIALSPVRYDHLAVDITKATDEAVFRDIVTNKVTDEVQKQPEQFGTVAFQMYDLILTGEHSSLPDVEKWSHHADQIEFEIEGTWVTVRSVENRAKPAVENLQELSGQPTPPGILAKTILELESGAYSGFTGKLLEDFESILSKTNQSNTYHELRLKEEQIHPSSETARQIVLKECRQLLGEFIMQNPPE